MGLMEKENSFQKIALSTLNPNKNYDNPIKVVEILNHVLADEAILNMKTRNAKWNSCGQGFFELHNIFEIHNKQLNDVAEEISDRIQVLHGLQIGSFSEYLSNTRLVENSGITPDIHQLLKDHESIISFFSEDCRYCSKVYEDESTSELLISIIRQHEKMAWMFRSYIQSELPITGRSANN